MPKTKKQQKLDMVNQLKNDNDLTELLELEELVSEKITEGSKPTVKKKVANIPFYPPSSKFKRKLKQLALDEETSMQKILEEGLRYVISKRGDKFENWL